MAHSGADDRHSPGVVKLRKHFEAELDRLRKHNDKSRPDGETEKTRGQIDMAKSIVALCVEPPKVKTEE